MQIKKDSRQMPKRQEYMANKMYSDVVYGWLQVNSERDPELNVRWVDRKKVNFSKMAKELNLSRQTVSLRFKRLLDSYEDKGEQKQGLGLVKLNKDLDRYELLLLEPAMAMLIESATLQSLVAALSDNAINVFIYLLCRFLANGEKGFEFTLQQVKIAIGMATNTRSNNHVIVDILDILRRLGLIDFELIEHQDSSIYKIKEVRNVLPDF